MKFNLEKQKLIVQFDKLPLKIFITFFEMAYSEDNICHLYCDKASIADISLMILFKIVYGCQELWPFC